MDIQLSINSFPIQQVNNIKYVRVIIDNYLSLSNHKFYMNNKIAKGIGITCICRA